MYRSLDRVLVTKLFLISLHGGDFQEAKVVLPFLPEFQRELFSSITQLLNLPRYAKFKALAQKNEWNPNGRAIALISQLKETEIMQAKTEFTEQQDLEVATNLFDGHLRQIGDLNLEACSDFVKSKTGFVVKFVTKPGMDTWVRQTTVPTSAPATRVPLRLLPRKCALVTTIAPTSATTSPTVPGTTTTTSHTEEFCRGFLPSGCCSGRPVSGRLLESKVQLPELAKASRRLFSA